MLDGLYILNESGKCILSFPINGETSLSSHFSPYIPAKLPPYDWSQLIEVTPSQLIHLKKYGRLLIFMPCGASSPPLLMEQLADRVVEVIEAYFRRPITATLISDHRAEIVWILSEMLDTAIPRISQPDIVRQLVYKEDFLSKLMGNASLNASSSQSAVGAASKSTKSLGSTNDISSHRIPDPLVPWELPWRRSRVKHAKEELFVDVIEHAKLVAWPRSKSRSHFSSSSPAAMVSNRPSRVQIVGEIRLLSRLSNTPTVTIDLSSTSSAVSSNHSQLHPSVDLEKFKSSEGHVLVLTPADLESVAARYTLVSNNTGPVAVDLQREDSEKNGDGSFYVRVSTSIDTKVEHVAGLVVRIAFPPSVKTVKELSATTGDLDVSNPQKCEYRLQKTVPMGWNASLHALATDEDGNTVAPLYVDVRYSLTGRVLSDTKVKSIHITPQKLRSQDPPPYKGVRYQTVVDSYVVT